MKLFPASNDGAPLRRSRICGWCIAIVVACVILLAQRTGFAQASAGITGSIRLNATVNSSACRSNTWLPRSLQTTFALLARCKKCGTLALGRDTIAGSWPFQASLTSVSGNQERGATVT